jgi:hypothetical protein
MCGLERAFCTGVQSRHGIGALAGYAPDADEAGWPSRFTQQIVVLLPLYKK